MKINNHEVVETDLIRTFDWVPRFKWFPWFFYKPVEAHWCFIDDKYIYLDKQKYKELADDLDSKGK